MVAVEGDPLVVLVDRDAFGEVTALADPDLEQAVDDQVVGFSANPCASSGRLRTRSGYHRADSTGGMA